MKEVCRTGLNGSSEDTGRVTDRLGCDVGHGVKLVARSEMWTLGSAKHTMIPLREGIYEGYIT